MEGDLVNTMEDPQKVELSTFKRKHFAKLHQKIQTKYEEMQKRLEKSKSVDALTTLKDDYVYKEDKYASQSDVRESEDLYEEESEISIKHSIVVEDVHRNDASYQFFDFKEASVSESENTPIENYENHNNNTDTKFFGDEFSKMSLESLNEVSIEREASPTPSTPNTLPKMSIRNRIGSRISAAKEKRRREEKEKNATKDKKKESRDKVEKFILSNTTKQDIVKTFKKTKMATVSVALIEATGLEGDISEDKTRFLFCRFKLGSEKHKSKAIKSNTADVKWQELFNFNLFDEYILEISLMDKDVLIGRCVIDLTEWEKEKTHEMRVRLDEMGNVEIFMLLTISGTFLVNTLVDFDDYQDTQRRLSTVKKKFAWYHVSDDSADVGWLSVIVYGAKGILSQDNYCVLELGNERLQTHTEYKTSEPNWMKIFTLYGIILYYVYANVTLRN